MSDIRPWLKAHTRALHARVDAHACAFDMSTAGGVHAMLAFLARGIAPVEEALERAGASAVMPAFSSRTRRHLLPAVEGAALPPIRGEAQVWGALYVLEGSRIGASVLARQEPRLSEEPYFQERPGNAWQRFLDDLHVADRRIADRAAMEHGATLAFSAFLAERTALGGGGCASHSNAAMSTGSSVPA